MIRFKKILTLNSNGQGLIEYLIIMALMGVASIGVLRILQGTVTAQFANVVNSISNSKSKAKVASPKLESRHYKVKDFNNFVNGTKSNK